MRYTVRQSSHHISQSSLTMRLRRRTEQHTTSPENEVYDTDEISLTSTVSSEQEEFYEVDAILAEQKFLDEHGRRVTYYLTKWTGYPMHRSSWEPSSNLEGSTLLQTWAEEKAKAGRKFKERMSKFQTEWEIAQERAEAAKAKRKEKRAKKREKLATSNNEAPAHTNDSEDDLPIKPGRAHRSTNHVQGPQDISPLFETEQQRRVPRQCPLMQSSSEDNEYVALDDCSNLTHSVSPAQSDTENGESFEQSTIDVLPSVDQTPVGVNREDHPFTQPTSPSQRNAEKGECVETSTENVLPILEQTLIAPPSRSNIERGKSIENSTVDVLANSQQNNVQQEQHLDTTLTKNKTDKPGSSKSQPRREKNAIAESTGQRRANTTVAEARTSRNSAPAEPHGITKKGPGKIAAGSIRLVNQQKTSRKPWQDSDRQFTTLRFRNIAQKRSQAEATPDPSALDFVNDPLATLHHPATGSRPKPPTNDNPYGRRELGSRRVQEIERNDSSPPRGTIPLLPYEENKARLTCFEWRNRSCSYGAEKCRFLHRDQDASGKPYQLAPIDGIIPPKHAKPPLTCFYWLRGPSGCKLSANECRYAHWNTGFIAIEGKATEQIFLYEKPQTELVKTIAPQLSYSLPKKQITCWYWMKDPKGCIKPPEECEFAHENTGWLKSISGGANQPINSREVPCFLQNRNITGPACFFWNQGVCKKSESECPFPHRYTGSVANPPKTWEPPAGWRPVNELRGSRDQRATFSDKAPQAMPEVDILDEPVLAEFSRQDSTATLLSVQPDEIPSPTSPVTTTPSLTRASCTGMKQRIEDACKLNFNAMFTYNEYTTKDTTLDRRAFLVFHPRDHIEELDLITRWLLLHHVEVFNFWFDGAWEHFKKTIVKGGSGVIIAHPNFENWENVPNFGDVLRSKVRCWSIGVQVRDNYDPRVSTAFLPEYGYDRIEIFPHGGIIYITDSVFEKKPQQALKMIELFFSKINRHKQNDEGPIDTWRRVSDEFFPWRLAVRPELLRTVYDKYMADINTRNPVNISHEKLFVLLSKTGYIEQDPCASIEPSCDYFPIMSPRFERMEKYYSALSYNQAEADKTMLQHFSRLAIDLRQYYRQLFVVHTDPEGDGRDWKKTFQTIDEVMTPEKFIEYFEQPAKGNRFEFYEWALP